MVFRLLKAGWRTKKKMPTDDFARLLSSALGITAKSEDPSPIERQHLRTYLEQLEAVAPADPHLTDIHVRAVGYIRGYLKVQDLQAAWQSSRQAGKSNEASKTFQEMKRWITTWEEVSGEFALARQELKTNHLALFEQLTLPPRYG